MPDASFAPPPFVPKPRLPTPSPSACPARLWWLALLAVLFALNNIAFFPTLTRIDPPGPGALVQIVIGMEMGSIFSQMLILSFFAVLGPGKSLLRQGVVWLVAVALAGSFAAGVAIASTMDTAIYIGGPGGSMFVSLFAVPAVLCACQTPLWGLRYFARWRTATSNAPECDLGQISIRGLLAATTLVAVVLGLCRLGLWLEAQQWGEGQYGQPLSPLVWWSGIGIASAIAFAFSLVVLPVTSLLVLRSHSGLLGLAYATAYLATCAVAFLVVASIIARNFPSEEGCTILFLYFLCITGYLLTSLAIFRWAGYRLWWGRPEP
ncbi:MAG: hypothetical protein ACKVP0_02510 [Pirellulaceae bacterium]